MNFRIKSSLLCKNAVFACLLISNANFLIGKTTNWQVTGGNYLDGANWDNGVPETGDTVVIGTDNGGNPYTVLISETTTPIAGSLGITSNDATLFIQSLFSNSMLVVENGITNAGTIRFDGNTYSGNVQRLYVNSGELLNTGTINFYTSSDTPQFFGSLSNSGAVNIYHNNTRFYLHNGNGTYKNDGTFTVHPSAGLYIDSDEQSFEQASGTLENNGTFRLTGADFIFSGGTISGNAINLQNGSDLKLQSTGSGLFVFENATHLLEGNIATGQTIRIQAVDVNAIVYVDDSFENEGTLEFRGNNYTGNVSRLYMNTGTFTNSGSVTMFDSADTPQFYGDLINNGTFTIGDIASYFYKVGETATYLNNGNVTINSGTQLFLSQEGQTFIQQAGSLNNNGSLYFDNADFIYNGGSITGNQIYLRNNSDLTLNHTGAAYFRIEGPTHVFEGDVAVDQTLRIQAIDAHSIIYVDNNFTNAGIIELSGNNYSGNVARINIASGTLTNTGTLSFFNSADTPDFYGNLTNDGTVNIYDSATYLNKSEATGTFRNNANFNIASGATLIIDAAEETFVQSAGTLDIQGTFNMYNAAFQYDGGTITGNRINLYDYTDLIINHPGPGDFYFEHERHNFTGDISANQTMTIQAVDRNAIITVDDSFTNAGTINFRGNNYSGNVARIVFNSGFFTNTGTVNMYNSADTPDIYGDVVNDGIFNIYDNQAYFHKVGETGTFTNNATFNIGSGAALNIDSAGETFVQANGTLDNQGEFRFYNSTFQYDGGSITGNRLYFYDYANLTVNHDGPGTFFIEQATHEFSGNLYAGQEMFIRALDQNAIVTVNGNMSNGGFINFSGNNYSGNVSRLYMPGYQFSNSGEVRMNESSDTPQIYADVVNSGILRFDDSDSDIVGAFFNLPTGTIRGSGTLDLNGYTLQNEGIYSPGNSVGTLTINGNATNSNSSKLLIEIASGGSDRLNVTGSWNISGTLEVAFLESFEPAPTDVYSVLSSGSLSGKVTDFSNVSELGEFSVPGGFMKVQKSGNTLVLSGFSDVAEPEQLPTVDFLNRFSSSFDMVSLKIADSEGTATHSASVISSGGNPRDYWEVIHNYGPQNVESSATISVLNYLRTNTWDPSIDGEISSLDISIDVKVFFDGASGAVAFGPALIQDGIVYTAVGDTASQGASWNTYTFSGLDASDFSNSGSHPDFTVGGSAITFGFFTANGTAGSATSTTAGYDNFAVSVTEASTPTATYVGQVHSTSYDMLNGWSGSYAYRDETYNGNGSPNSNSSPLSDGLGQLTDGVIGSSSFVANLGNGNAYEWVGWYLETPVITFDFTDIIDFSKVVLFLGRDLGGVSGNVNIPGTVLLEFGRKDAYGDVFFDQSFIYDIPDEVESPLKSKILEIPAANSGQYVRITLNDGLGPWVFLSEVMFFDQLAAPLPTAISYDDFDSIKGLYLASPFTASISTAYQAGNALQLQPNRDYTQGGFIFNAPQRILDGFYTDFEMVLTQVESVGGDGFAFHVSDEINWGPGIASQGRESLTIRFDTYQNSGEISDNFVQVSGRNGALVAQADLNPLAINLEDGAIHRFEFLHNGQYLNIKIDGVVVLSDVFVPAAEFANIDGEALVGFGSYSANVNETYLLLNWHFEEGTSGSETFAAVPEVSPPVFSPIIGQEEDAAKQRTIFVQRAEITLSETTAGSTIRYTLDGSEPDSSSIVYSTPIEFNVAGNYLIKAKAFKSGLVESETVTGEFQILQDGRGFVTYERYDNIWSSDLPALLNDPVFATIPAYVDLLDYTEAPQNSSDFYGSRIRGYVEAPESGLYRFYISSDDRSSLLLSTDENPSNAVEIARVDSSTSYRAWTSFASQTSLPVSLVAGERYYFEARHVDYSGGDNLSIGWQLPSGSFERPLDSSRIFAFGLSDIPGFRPVDFSSAGSVYNSPVSLELSHKNLSADIYFTLDGSIPTTSSTIYSSAIDISTETLVSARAFVSGTPVSGVTRHNYIFDASAAFPQTGLVQWYRASERVQSVNGKVSQWENLVSNLSNSGFRQFNKDKMPLIVDDVINGSPAIRFDGVDDGMWGDSTTYTTNPYSIYVVYQRLGKLGRLIQGSNGTNWLLGLHATPGFYANGWVRQNAPGSADLNTWNVALGSRGSEAKYYLNGQDMTFTKSPSGIPGNLAIGGGEGTYNGETVNADIAEILVFDHQLTDEERAQVDLYLSSRYNIYKPVVDLPVHSSLSGSFADPISVTISVDTPDVDIYYTTDGSEPTESSTLYTGAISVNSSSTLRARGFKSGFSASGISSETYLIGESDELDSTNMLLWLRADRGVSFDASGEVVSWSDSSGNGYAATTNGYSESWRPSFQSALINGHPALGFDDASLKIENINIQRPSTVFIVYQPVTTGGYLLTGSSAWRLGQSTSSSDFVAGGTVGDGAPLILNAPNLAVAVQNESFSRFYYNGSDYTTNSSYSGGIGSLNLGGYLGSYTGNANSAIAEIIVYNSSLTDSERLEVEAYLASKYNIYTPKALAPIIETASGSFVDPVEVSVSNPDSASELRYTLDGSIPTVSSALYSGPITISSITTLRVRAFRPGYDPSDIVAGYYEVGSTTAAFDTTGLQLWLRADDGLSVSSDGSSILKWADLSGNGFDAAIDNISKSPSLVPSGIGGKPSIQFDGVNDTLFVDTALSVTRPSTVFAVFARTGNVGRLIQSTTTNWILGTWSNQIGFYANGWIRNGIPAPLNEGFLAVSRQTGNESKFFLNGEDLSSNTAPSGELRNIAIGGAGGTYNEPANVQLAEMLVFDRDLNETERSDVEAYLANKYSLYDPQVVTPSVLPASGTIQASVNVSMSVPVLGASIRYTVDGSEPNENSALYTAPISVAPNTTVKARAFKVGFEPSNVQVSTYFASEGISIPLDGLSLWLDAETDTVIDVNGGIELWPDISGNGFDAYQNGSNLRPILSEQTDHTYVRFETTSDGMIIDPSLSIDGDYTAFVVFKRYGTAASGDNSLFQSRSNGWFVGPYSSLYGFYNSSTWISPSNLTSAQDTVYISAAMRSEGISSFYRNGSYDVANRFSLNSPGTLGLGFEGTRGGQQNYDLGEVIVYNRGLSLSEIYDINTYLAQKWGAELAPVQPEIQPRAGHYNEPITVAITNYDNAADIYYTTDGSTPTSSSTLYSSPFNITEDTVLKAIAVTEGVASTIASNNFLISASETGSAYAEYFNGNNSTNVDLYASTPDFPNNPSSFELLSSLRTPVNRGNNYVALVRGYLHPPQTGEYFFRLASDDGSRFFLSTDDDPANISLKVYYNSATSVGNYSAGIQVDQPVTLEAGRRYYFEARLAEAGGGDFIDVEWQLPDTTLEGPIPGIRMSPYGLTDEPSKLVPPVISPNGGLFSGPTSVSISHSKPGVEIRYTLDGSEPTESSSLYAGSILLSSETTINARAFSDGFTDSAASSSQFYFDSATDFSRDGLAIWYRSDLGVDTDADKVLKWVNLADKSNPATQATVDNQPSLIPSSLNGEAVVRFDGANDFLDFEAVSVGDFTVAIVMSVNNLQSWAGPFTNRISGQPGFMLSNAVSSTTAFQPHLMKWSGSSETFNAAGSTYSGLPLAAKTYIWTSTPELLLNGLDDNAQTGAAGSWGTPQSRIGWSYNYFGGDISEIIVYNRILTDEEQSELQLYLSSRYATPFLLNPPVMSPQGGLYETEQQVTLSHPLSGVEIRYTLDGSEPTSSSLLYSAPLTISSDTTLKAKAFYAGATESSQVSGTFYFDNTTDFDRNGLVFWMRGDSGVVEEAGSISTILDLSGSNHNLIQTSSANQPSQSIASLNGHDSVLFDGSNDFLNISAGFDDFSDGLTIFVVAKASGSTSNARFLDLGNGQTSNNIIFGREGNLDNLQYITYNGNSSQGVVKVVNAISTDSLNIFGVVHEPSQVVTLLKNGVAQSSSVMGMPTNVFRSSNYLGRSNWSSDGYYQGEIGEVLVFNRALESAERESVNEYLRLRYGIASQTVNTPAISPNGGFHANSVSVTIGTTTPSSRIYYTLDGSIPDESDTLYAGTFSLTESATLTTRAFKAGYNPSAPRSTFFRIGDAPGNGDGLAATYYDNSDFTGISVKRIDSVLDFNWNSSSPDPYISTDTFSAVWEGQLKAQFTENYTLILESDDGVRMQLGGVTLIDSWVNGSSRRTAEVNLVKGQLYDLRIEYYDNAGAANLRFKWSSYSQPEAVVPVTQLFSGKPFNQTAKTPIANPRGDTFPAQVSVNLSTATPDASIRYTTDGTTPDETSALYSGSILVTANTTLRAIAYSGTTNPSGMFVDTYFVDNSGPSLSSPTFKGSPLADNQNITTKGMFAINASDASGVARVDFFISSSPGGSETLLKSDTNGTDGYNAFWEADLTPSNGVYQLRIVAYDTYNSSTEQIINLNLLLAPPAAPVITSPINGAIVGNNQIFLKGTASANSTVYPVINGNPSASGVQVGSTGTFNLTIGLQTGINSISAFATNRSGDSANATVVSVELDNSLPSSPNGVKAEARTNGRIRLTWLAPSSSNTTGYHIYRSTSDFTTTAEAIPIASNFSGILYDDTPTTDGQYYYRVQTINAVGNLSPLSSIVSAKSDRTGPIATMVTLTHENPAMQVGTRLGKGTVNVEVTLSEPTAGAPFVSINPNGSNSIVLSLTKKSDTTYAGAFGISESTADGNASVTFSARDSFGNAGNSITTGGQWYFDTAGPKVTQLSIDSSGVPIANQNDPDPAEVTVSLVLSEAPVSTPVFTYYLSEALDTTPQNLTLTQGVSASNWNVTFSLPSDAGIMPEDYLVFEYSGSDSFGNASNVIDGENGFLVYQGNLPELDPTGSFFAESLPGGIIRLGWLEVPEASGYRLYRSDVNGENLSFLTEISGSATITYDDATASDGAYKYALTTLREANGQTSESAQSSVITVTADRTAPLPPENLQLQLVPQGIAATWNLSPSSLNEVIKYNFYRGSDNPITDVSGLALRGGGLTVNAVTDPSPSSAEPSYVVTAVDATGNESIISNSAFLNAGLLPVQNLKVYKKSGFPPFISWDSAEIAVNGYEVAKGFGANLQPVATVASTSFSDTGYNSGSEQYTLTVIDTFSARSLPRSLTLPEVVFARSDTKSVRRGLMNRLYYTVTNQTDNPINHAILKIKLAGRTHQSSEFSVSANNSREVSVVVGGYSELTGSSAQTTQILELRPHPGELVELEQTGSVTVSNGGLTATVLGSGFQRGTNAKVSFTVYNPSDLIIEIVLAKSSGNLPSDEVRFRLTDGATVLASIPAQVGSGQGIVSLSNGTTVLRLPAKAEYTSPEFDLPVPLNSPRTAQLNLVIDKVYSALGRPEQVTLTGTEALANVIISDVDFSAVIQSVSPAVSNGSEPITLSGQTLSTSGGAPQANRPLTVVVLHEGFERTYSLTSDASGNFSMDFTPLKGESGKYQVWARHPDLNDRSVQQTFVIERLIITPSTYELRQPRGVSFNIPFRVVAADGTQATNLRAIYEEADQLPGGSFINGITVTPGPAVTLSDGGSANLSLGFLGNNSAPERGSFRVRIISDERPTDGWGFLTVNYVLLEGRPALTVSKSSFQLGVNPGGAGLLSLSLSNEGVVSAQNIELNLLENSGGSIRPGPTWMSLSSGNRLDSLGVGSSKVIDINLSVPAEFALGIYHYGLRIRSSNNSDIIIPIDLTVSSSETGGLAFKILDIYTGEPDPDYVAPGTEDHPTPTFSGVDNVRITLQSEVVTSQVFTGQSDGFGEKYFADIPTGRYKYRLTSDRHREVTGRVRVQPGTIITETAQLQNERVVVQWEVVPITIEDRYEILLTATFETEVPAPVVVVTPAAINLPAMCAGDVYNGEITLANYGLISADEFTLPIPATDDNFYYELLDAVPDTLGAGEVVIIPFRVTCLQPLFGNCEVVSSEGAPTPQSSGCYYTACVTYDYGYKCINGLKYRDRGTICWTGSGRGCGGGGRGYSYNFNGGDPVGGGGGYGPGGGYGGGWSPITIPLPNQPPDCDCDPDPCCQSKGK